MPIPLVVGHPSKRPTTFDRKRASGHTLTCGLSALGGVGPGHQLVDAGRRPAVDELGENVGGPGERIDGVEFAGLEKRGNHGPSRRASIVAGEQRVFSCQGQTADRTLDRVGIDLDAAVFEEAAQAVPVVETIGDPFGELAALRHPGKIVLEPGLQGFDDGF